VRDLSTRLLLVFILVLTTFSALIVFPSNPDRYLPNWIPWPEEECVGPICIGRGLNALGLERREMQLGLDPRAVHASSSKPTSRTTRTSTSTRPSTAPSK
jgi:hypothetical protein